MLISINVTCYQHVAADVIRVTTHLSKIVKDLVIYNAIRYYMIHVTHSLRIIICLPIW